MTRTIKYKLLKPDSLDFAHKELIERAVHVRKNAYAPYSEYSVGVAILSELGNIYTGCNVERATYTQTSHGEQSAIDSMVAAEGDAAKVCAVVVVAAPKDVQFTFPEVNEEMREGDLFAPSCGHCLQIIWEHAHGDRSVKLLQLLPSGMVGVTTIGDALPFAFSLKQG